MLIINNYNHISIPGYIRTLAFASEKQYNKNINAHYINIVGCKKFMYCKYKSQTSIFSSFELAKKEIKINSLNEVCKDQDWDYIDEHDNVIGKLTC